MNTSIITSQTNSLPSELIIKLIYYLDEKTLSEFSSTCVFIQNFNFKKLLIPYKVLYDYDMKYVIDKNNILEWFEHTLKRIYDNNSMNDYLKDLCDTFDTIANNNISDRIKKSSDIIYSNLSVNRHQSIRCPVNRETHDFRIDNKPTDRRYIKTKLHSIMNINKFTYTHLRRNHFTVLGLIY